MPTYAILYDAGLLTPETPAVRGRVALADSARWLVLPSDALVRQVLTGDRLIGGMAVSDEARRSVTLDALSLSGSGQYLSRARGTDFDLSAKDWWVAGWSYHTTAGDADQLFCISDTGTSNYIEVYISGAEQIVADWYDGTDNPNAGTAAGTVGVNTWHFWIAYWDNASKTIGLSMDGGAFATDTNAAYGASPLGGTTLFLGHFPGTTVYDLHGRQQHVMIGKSPTSSISTLAATIRNRLYFSGNGLDYQDLTAAEKTAWGLVEYWRLSEASGTRVGIHAGLDLAPTGSPGATTGHHGYTSLGQRLDLSDRAQGGAEVSDN